MSGLRSELKLLGLWSVRIFVVVLVLQIALFSTPAVFDFFSNIRFVAHKYRDLFALILTASLITIVIFSGIAVLEKEQKKEEK